MSTLASLDEFDGDTAVVEAFLRGEPSAFDELARRYSGWVRAIIFSVLCDRDRLDDVAQHVWATVWERVHGLREPGRWRPWLYRLARNAALDDGRATTRQRAAMRRPVSDVPVPASPMEAAGRAEVHDMVLAAVRGLPAIYREPFVLRHLQDWSYKRIAEVMELPVDTVETRLVRARRLLREALKDRV